MIESQIVHWSEMSFVSMSTPVEDFVIKNLYGFLENMGDVPLKVYYNGKLCMTVEPHSNDSCVPDYEIVE